MSLQALISLFSKSYIPTTGSNGQFYESVATDPAVMQSRPWKTDPKYFTKCAISSLALFKMAVHAASGGNIEIMGSLIGKIHNNTIIIITDVYAIPVEGTETRVNAQLEGYEYIVLYLQLNRQLRPNENIVGWYHSHPGYGCWLSGIDVSTQSLNQIQDPYLAIVIDPLKSVKQGKIDIGAFRTYPDGFITDKNISEERRAKFGNHADKYYSLDIEIYTSNADEKLCKYINKQTWVNELVVNTEVQESAEVSKMKAITQAHKLVQDLGRNNFALEEFRSKLYTQSRLDIQFNQLFMAQLSTGKPNTRKEKESPAPNHLGAEDDMMEDDTNSAADFYDDDEDTSSDEASIYTRSKKIKRKIVRSRESVQLMDICDRLSSLELQYMEKRELQHRLFS